MTKPPCPFTIKSSFAGVTYAADISAPSSKLTYNYDSSVVLSYVNAYVMKRSNASEIASSTFNSFEKSIDDAGTYFSHPNTYGFPGNYPESDPTKMLDSLHVDAAFMVSGGAFVHAWRIYPGNIDANAQLVIGPTTIATGHSGTWRSYPSWDTTAYSYKWIVDGQEIPGSAYAMYHRSFTAGTHVISNVTIRADETRDTVSVTVKSYNVAISGPTSVRPLSTCSWSGSASAGTAPYAFEWSAPGGGGSSQWFNYTNSAGSGGGFAVQLAVTDATGTQIYVTRQVSVSSAAPVCPF